MEIDRDAIRSLTELEIAHLETALGKPVNRDDLVFWVTEATRDIVRLIDMPTARQSRDALRKLSHEGREWLDHIRDCPGARLLGSAQLEEVDALVRSFCDNLESNAKNFLRQ